MFFDCFFLSFSTFLVDFKGLGAESELWQASLEPMSLEVHGGRVGRRLKGNQLEKLLKSYEKSRK